MKRSTSKWFVCGLLFLATLVNYLDRQTLSVSASKIAEEMHLTDIQLGQLFFAFFIAYGVAHIVIGPVLDRFNAVWAYAIAVAAWSMAGASSALATGFATLFTARLLLGICESPNWPLALRVVTRMFPPSQRSLATGFFHSGSSVATIIAPPIIIYLTTTYNWRVSFVVVGAVGLIWSAIWLAWFRWQPEPAMESAASWKKSRHQTDGGSATDAPADTSPASIGEIVRTRTFWALMVATCFLNPLQYFYTNWIPRYFDKYAGVGFGKELAGRLIVVYVAFDIGLWTGGAVVALLSRRMPVWRARMIVTTVGALCMMTSPAISQLHNVDVITALLCVATFGVGWFMMNYLACSAEVSATRVSTAVGLLSGSGCLAGAAFMLLVGGVVEKYQSFNLAFWMTGLMPLVALAGMWLSVPTKERQQ